jgi:hypothetical protein
MELRSLQLRSRYYQRRLRPLTSEADYQEAVFGMRRIPFFLFKRLIAVQQAMIGREDLNRREFFTEMGIGAQRPRQLICDFLRADLAARLNS